MTHEPQVLGQSAHLWTRTSLRPKDVDVAELYDGFSFNCLSWLEALGFCGIGEAKDFLDGGKAIARDGVIPLNTHGGQLSHGRTHGMGLIHEAVTQLRGEAGERQVDGRPRRRRQQRRPDPQRRDPATDRRVSAPAPPRRPRRRRADVGPRRRGRRTARGRRRVPRRGKYRSVFRLSRTSAAVAAARSGRTTATPWWHWIDPGYGSSAPYPDAMERPEQRVALAYGAIDKILGTNSARRRAVSRRPFRRMRAGGANGRR